MSDWSLGTHIHSSFIVSNWLLIGRLNVLLIPLHSVIEYSQQREVQPYRNTFAEKCLWLFSGLTVSCEAGHLPKVANGVLKVSLIGLPCLVTAAKL